MQKAGVDKLYRGLALAAAGAAAAVVLASSTRVTAQQQGPMADDQVPISFAMSLKAGTLKAGAAGGGGVLGRKSNGGLLGIDSLPNWSSYFYRQGEDSNGFLQFTWQYTMVGNAPFGQGDDQGRSSGTTWINAPIVPVNLDLREADGSPRFVNGQRLFSDVSKFVNPVLKSPIFDKAPYDSSERPTQFNDAIQRAEFFRMSDDDWHTMLRPSVKTTRTMVLRRGTYRFALNADGTCCAFVLINDPAFEAAFFPPTFDLSDTSTVIGAAEHAKDIRTSDLATFLFPNAFLYFNNDPSNCCVLGFHTYDLEQGDASNGFRERRFVLNYSSWVSPGIFGGDVEDVNTLGHEMSETFNDPFVNNATPWWLDPTGNICQNNLETGDVLEALPLDSFPITLNGFTYHPQNEAILQWFAGQTPSNAIHRAYSYPDTTMLPTPSVSMKAGCTGPVQ